MSHNLEVQKNEIFYNLHEMIFDNGKTKVLVNAKT